MSEKISDTAMFVTTPVERPGSPVSSSSDDVFHSTQNSGNFEFLSQTKYGKDEYQRRNSDIPDTALFNWQESCQRSSSTNAIDQLVHPTISTDINYDPYPEHIRRQNNNRITYRQNVSIRYLQPPTPPPSGPIIIREIRPLQPPEAPPLIIRQRPPVPKTPPPIVIRERPPIPPRVEPSRIVNRYLPAPLPSPRRVIIERQASLPQKPQPVIIEKWLPYKSPAQRRVVIEHAPPSMQRPVQKNTVITYDAPRVNIVQNVHNLGTVRVDPHMYSVQYGSHLASSEYVRNTMARFGIGNNYSQMIQMQSSPRSSTINNTHFQAIDNCRNTPQAVAYDERRASSSYSVPHGNYSGYFEKQIEETILPDGRRKHRTSISGTNEQEILRQAELYF